MREVKAPNSYVEQAEGKVILFLAGSIEMGKAEDWQSRLVTASRQMTASLTDFDNLLVLNPRRDEWNCVDQETKILTPVGIRSWDQIRVGDPVYTFSQERNLIEIQPVDRVNIFDVETELVEFVRNRASFFFTENHDLLDRISIRHSRTKKVKASSFVGKNEQVRFPAGKSVADVASSLPIPNGRGFLDDHFRLAAWFLSEGSTFIRQDTGARTVTIAQYKKNHVKVDEIEEVLVRLGMSFSYDDRQFKLDKDSGDFVIGVMAMEKGTIPAWVMEAPIRQRKIFIETFAKGDGCIVDGRISYLCFGEPAHSLAEQMVVLCFESGIGTKWMDKTSGFGHPVINLVPHNDDKKWFCLKCKGKVPYKGKVWCPTTANGTWVAYRNGIPFITGNSSWKQSKDFPPFREQVEWELRAQEDADVIAMHFVPETKSPITLLELGLFSDDRLVVYCPEGFWRKGNVDIVCERYGITTADSWEDFVKKVRAKIERAETQTLSRVW